MTQLYSALHDLYLQQKTPEEILRHEAYCSLLAEGFTWKQISLSIEQMDSAQERFYLRSLEFMYVSQYITTQWEKLNLNEFFLNEKNTMDTEYFNNEYYMQTLEKGLFLFDLQWQTQIDFSDWQKQIQEAEDSIRFRLAREGIDLHALQNFSESTKFLKLHQNDFVEIINNFLFDELQIESSSLVFFKISAHNIYQVASGNQVATSFTVSLLLLLLLLRLKIPVRGIIFNKKFFLEIFYGSEKIYLEVDGKVKVSSNSFNSSNSLGFLQSIFKTKAEHLQTLCREFPQELQFTKHLNFLQTLEKKLFS